MTRLAGLSMADFPWSTSEQVWPFEKNSLGHTLYCKEVDFGYLPYNTSKTVAHNIPELTADVTRLFSEQYIMKSTGQSYPVANPYSPSCVATAVIGANVYAQPGAENQTYVYLTARLIYSKGT